MAHALQPQQKLRKCRLLPGIFVSAAFFRDPQGVDLLASRLAAALIATPIRLQLRNCTQAEGRAECTHLTQGVIRPCSGGGLPSPWKNKVAAKKFDFYECVI